MRACSSRVTSRKLWLTSAVGAFAALALAGTAWSGEAPKKDEVFKVTHVIQVPGAAAFFSFDISFYDPHLNKYFLTDRNNKAIDVINASTNSLTQLTGPAYAGFSGNNDTSGPDGILTVHQAGGLTELWIGDSNTCSASPAQCNGTDAAHTPGPGRVWVLNASSGAIISPSPILVGGNSRADELCYDPRNHVIMIASPAESPPYVTFIDTNSKAITGKLIFDGLNTPMAAGVGHAPLKATNGLEQCQYSEGKFYQNVPEVNGPGNDTVAGAVAVINPKTMNVVNSFSVPLDACAGPQGMTIGPHDQILLGCNAKSPNGHRNLAVINQDSGAVLATIPDLGGADEVWYNKGDGHYFIASCNTACRTSPVTGAVTGPELLGVVDADRLRLDQSVTIATQNSDIVVLPGNPRTAHSVAANSETNEVYLPLPATGGNAPQFGTSLCDTKAGPGITVTGSPSSATGCIAILKAKHDDRPRFARERDHHHDGDDRRDRDDRHDGDDHHHDD